MYIKEIEINNFRIYKDSNIIQILPEDDKNIVVISGKNGFGWLFRYNSGTVNRSLLI
jgi:DNA sulfur modification protein DndD